MLFRFQFLLFFFALLVFQTPFAETAEDEDDVTTFAVIELESAIQETMGIETAKVKTVSQPVYRSTYGKVLDLTPLLNFRRDCLISQSQLHQARRQLDLSRKALNRLEQMFKNKATSSRKLEQQRRQWLADQTLFQQSQIQYHTLLAESRLRWNTLADNFCQSHAWVNDLLSGKDKILAVVRPDIEIAAKIQQLPLNVGQNELTVSVRPLDDIDLFDPVNQSSFLLFITSAQLLHPGQHFSVSVPLAADSVTGLLIPKNALLWHLGQAFVYIKIDQEHFQHRNIEQFISVHNGYLVTDSLKPDEEIVISGAQQLLSTEFRSQLADEDDD